MIDEANSAMATAKLEKVELRHAKATEDEEKQSKAYAHFLKNPEIKAGTLANLFDIHWNTAKE